MTEHKLESICVVGAGLVGSLTACYFAKRGYAIHVYEKRSDSRKQQQCCGRSINLAVSFRARSALAKIGLEDIVCATGISMHGRMIHKSSGEKMSIQYGTKDQCLLAVDRKRLNDLLLDSLEEYHNVQLHFQHNITYVNVSTGQLFYEKQNNDSGIISGQSTYDLIVGCDGAHSNVRYRLINACNGNYNQHFIDHGYIEIRFPPTFNSEFSMEKNFLHIWPRDEFMMIALPNLDKSFTGTLFMPFKKYSQIQTSQDLLALYEATFPDSLDLIGRENLVNSFFKNPVLPLITIQCNPYHYKNKCVIMGDAAHAMVPFYGQGMNCGFEDVEIFFDLMDKHSNNFDVVLPLFTEVRNKDAKAICDLAMYNYIEMRHNVNSKLFLLRKKLDNFLFWLFPKSWIPLYTMVSFTSIPYTQCVSDRQWQDKIMNIILLLLATGGCTSTSLFIYKTSVVSSIYHQCALIMKKLWQKP